MTLVVDETHQDKVSELWRYAEFEKSRHRNKAITVDADHAGVVTIHVQGTGRSETYDIPVGAEVMVLNGRQFTVKLPAVRKQLTFKLGLGSTCTWTVCRRETEPPRPRRGHSELLAML